jgi:hypothetical protein
VSRSAPAGVNGLTVARLAAAAVGTIALGALTAAALWPHAGTWDAWRAATCMPDACFCEALRDGRVKQPVNAASSLAFVFVGVLILLTGRADRERDDGRGTPPRDAPRAGMRGSSRYALVFAVALIVTGLGSAFYHASLSFVGQFADVMGMYLIATFVILYALGRMRRLSTATVVASYVAANAALATVLVTLPALRRYLFAVVLLIGLAAEYAARRRARPAPDGRLLLGAVALLTAAFTLWVLDITKLLCAPTSVLQGHAAWHILGAAAAWLLYGYYRSEDSTGMRPSW